MQDTFVREFALRRLPLWSPNLTLMATFAVGCMAHSLASLGQGASGREVSPADLQSVGICCISLGLLLIGLLRRLLVRARPLPPIEFLAESLSLPRHAEAWRSRQLPYDAIVAIHLLGRASRQDLLVETPRFWVHLPQRLFVEPRALERLVFELRRRIEALPQSSALLEETAKARQATLQRMQPSTLVTQGAVGLMGVLFANTYLKGALDKPMGLLRWGANSPARIADGEWFRLLSANFLHDAGLSPGLPWLHVSLNALALFYLGGLVERLLGWQRCVLILATGALCCNLVLLAVPSIALSSGSAGMLFALLGSFAAINWRMGLKLPLGLRQPGRWWLMVALLGGLQVLLWPVGELCAHLASLACGSLLTLRFFGRRSQLPEPANRWHSGLAAAVLILLALSLGAAIRLAAASAADG